MFTRTRRLRQSSTLREMVKNVTVSLDQMIYPIFIEEGKGIKEEIPSMPNQYRYSIDIIRQIQFLVGRMQLNST